MVDIAPGTTAAGTSGAGDRIDMDAIETRQVDHDPVIACAKTGAVVATASHRDQQTLIPREGDRNDHVGDIDAARDDCGMLVDHAVVDRTSRLVIFIARQNHFTAK